MKRYEELFVAGLAAGQEAKPPDATQAMAEAEAVVAPAEAVVAPATDSSPVAAKAAEVAQAAAKVFKGWSTSLPGGSVFGHGTGHRSPFGGPPPPCHGSNELWRR